MSSVSAWEAVSIRREEHVHTPLLEDFAKLKWGVTLPLKTPSSDDHTRQFSQNEMIGVPFPLTCRLTYCQVVGPSCNPVYAVGL